MHVLVIGRQDAALVAAMRAVVHDWSAVGLTGPTIWADPDTRSGLAAIRIADGRREDIDLRSWMPRHPGPVRVVSVQALTEPDGCVPYAAVDAWARALRLPPDAPMINVLVPDDATTSADPAAIHDSRINVMVQAVDSTDPRAVLEPLSRRSATFVMHAAAALATAGGMWTGTTVAPLDQEQLWTGSAVAMGRSYLRRLDATPVLDRVAEEVFGAQSGRLPVARSGHGEPLGVVAPAAQLSAAEAAAQAVLAKHAAVTRFHEPPPFQAPDARKRGLGETLKLFFSFLGQALRKAPQAWAREVIDGARRRVESGATRFFYGEQSGYQVVLSGVASAGPAGIDQAGRLEQAAVGLLSQVAPGSEPPVTRVPQLWEDTVRTVAALADGGESDPSIRLPGDVNRLVVDDPSRLCPRPGEQPFRLPQGSPGAETGPIRANDPWHARQVDRILAEHAQQLDATAGRPGQVDKVAGLAQLRHQLQGWVGQRRCATWAVSDGLAGELERARIMQAEMLAASADGKDVDLEAPLAAQRRVRRGVLSWLLVLLVGVVVAVVLRVTGLLPTAWAVGVGLAVLVISLIGAFVTFTNGQRALWQAIHRIDVAARRREWLATHGVAVTQEVFRLANVYRQSQVWADVVSEYVTAPFGSPPGAGGEQVVPARLVGELPLAVMVATAQYEPRAHEPVVYAARARVLAKDWLQESIELRRSQVLRTVRDRTGRDLSDRLTSDAELVPGGPLLSYLEVLREPATRHRAWEQSIDRLVDGVRTAGVVDRLLPTVHVDAGAIRGAHSWSDLTGGLVGPRSELSDDGLTDDGSGRRMASVSRSFLASDTPVPVSAGLTMLPVEPAAGRRQLDRLLVRWDLTSAMGAERLVAFRDSAATSVPNRLDGGPQDVIDVES